MTVHMALRKGFALTECQLTELVRRSDMTTDLSKVTCLACRAQMIGNGTCPECGHHGLTWDTWSVKTTGVPEGRLRSNEVATMFFLGCDGCSETLITRVTADEVAAALTENGWRPER